MNLCKSYEATSLTPVIHYDCFTGTELTVRESIKLYMTGSVCYSVLVFRFIDFMCSHFKMYFFQLQPLKLNYNNIICCICPFIGSKNGLYLYFLFSKTTQSILWHKSAFIHSTHIHSYSGGRGRQGATRSSREIMHQDLGYLDEGHLDMQIAWAGNQTTDWLVCDCFTSWATELVLILKAIPVVRANFLFEWSFVDISKTVVHDWY